MFDTPSTMKMDELSNFLLQISAHGKSSAENSTDTGAVPGPMSMDDLIAWANGTGAYTRSKEFGIMRGVSGIISTIASCILLWMIFRSHERLSSTKHRLLLGVCVTDMVYSLSYSTFNVMAPSDDDYMTWNARGNEVTCDIQGSMMTIGGLGGMFYSSALNLYFLSIVKFNKSNEFIRDRIEPFLHAVPLLLPISEIIYNLIKEHYNHDGSGICAGVANFPPHCLGYGVGEVREGFEIPCYRGLEGALPKFIGNIVLMFIPVAIITISLGVIYVSVRTQEKKLEKYGAGSLKDLNQSPASTSQKSGSQLFKKRDKNVVRTPSSKDRLSKSRAVSYQAIGYSLAWYCTYGSAVIGCIIFLTTGIFPPVLLYMNFLLSPLGGFFNLLIFMHPKMMAAKKRSTKRGGENISWCQAFAEAFWSRGRKVGGKKQGSSSKARPKRNTDNTTDTARTSNQNDTSTPPQEEENC